MMIDKESEQRERPTESPGPGAEGGIEADASRAGSFSHTLPASDSAAPVAPNRAPVLPAASSALGSRAPAQVPLRVAPFSAVATDSLPVVLWRSRWIMLLCLFLATAGGIAYLQTATPIYTSTAKLYLDYAGIRIGNPYDPVGRPQTDKYLCTQAELIKSGPILTAASEVLAPRRLRTLADAPIATVYLQKNIAVAIGKKDEVIAISLRSPYPSEAAQIVNAIVDAYLASRSEHGQRNSAQVLRVLQDELQRTDRELDEKRNQLTAFRKDQMPLALGSDQGGGVMERYLEFQNAHTQAQIRRMDAEAFRKAVHALEQDPIGLKQYLQLRGNPGAYAVMDQEKAALSAKIVELGAQREHFLETLTADVPKVAALSVEIQRLQGQLKELDDRFARAVLAAAEREYIKAKDFEEQVAQSCREQREQVVMLNAEVAQYERLRSEVDQLTTYSQTREGQVREIRQIVGEDVDQLRMAVLEPAQPAVAPSEPQKARVMAMALILGLFWGGGLAVARDRLDQTLRSTQEISALLGVPVLGVVPAMSRRQRMPERGRKVLLRPDSHEAEAYRTIRTAVLFSNQGERTKTLLITSPAAGDGKSTLVSNLAIAMARAGRKTLILDADFRKPTQHAIFGLDPRERCLSDVFAGTMTLPAAIQATGIEGLDILTCGYRISNPAEVLHSPTFTQLLGCLTEVYDRIVIDAPPVTIVTDAQILGALCDATVLVLKADRCTRRAARHAIEALQSVGAHLLGVVVNEVRKSGDRYGYYCHRYRKYYNSAPGRSGAGQPANNIPAAALRAGPVAPRHEGTTVPDSRALSARMTAETAG